VSESFGFATPDERAHDRAAQLGQDLVSFDPLDLLGIDRELVRELRVDERKSAAFQG